MAISISNLFNNLPEGIHKTKFKYGHDDKKCDICGITYEVCDCFLVGQCRKSFQKIILYFSI